MPMCTRSKDWTGERGAHTFEILCSCTRPDIPSEYLEILGCHDTAFGWCVYKVCLAECGTQSRMLIVVVVAEKWREL